MSVTFHFEPPILDQGLAVGEITLRAPLVKDMLKLAKDGMTQADLEVGLIALLSGLSRECVEGLDIADYRKLQEALAGFTSRGRMRVGARSSSSPALPVGDTAKSPA